MPAPQRRFARAVPDVTTAPNGVETVVGTTPPVSSSFPGCCYLIEFFVAYQIQAGATSMTFAVRRDGLAGAIFDPGWQIGPIDTVNVNGVAPVSIVDQSAADQASIVWVLTAKPIGGAVVVAGGTAAVTIDVGGQPSTLD